MRADSCLFRLSAKRGPRPGARRFFATAIAGTKYRPLDALPYRLAVKEPVCTSVFTPITSPGMRSSASFVICCAIFASRWSSSGMAGKFINGRTSRPSLLKPAVSMFSGFPAMLLNSTRSSTFGRTGNAICRTAAMKPLTAWERICGARWAGFVVRSVSSDRASSILNFHGLETNVSIIS